MKIERATRSALLGLLAMGAVGVGKAQVGVQEQLLPERPAIVQVGKNLKMPQGIIYQGQLRLYQEQGPELFLPQLAPTPVPVLNGGIPSTTPESPQVVAPSDVAPQQLTPLEPQAQTPETPTVDTEPQAFREGATGETRPSVEPVVIPEVRMISEEKIGGSSYLRTFTTEKLGASIRVGVSGPEGHLGNLADFVGGKLDIIFAPSTDTNIRYDEPIIQGGRIVYREKIVRAGDLDLVYDGANYLLDAWKYRGWKRIHLPDGRIVIVFVLTDYGRNNIQGAAIGLAQSLQNVALIGSWYDRYSPNDRRGVDPSLNPEPRQNHGAPFLRLVYSP